MTQVTEKEIEKITVAPRVTYEDFQANIVGEHYFTALDGVFGSNLDEVLSGENCTEAKYPESLGLLTFCVLVLKNGFTVTGESACASPENYNKEIGQKIARQNAEQKIWALMGYELKTKLMEI